MSGQKPDPFDHTVILPGVPELPQEATQILPINQPRPDFEAPQAPEAPRPTRPRRGLFIALWIGAVAVLTTAFSLWLLGTGTGSSKRAASPSGATASTLPPSMQGYLDAAQKGDAKAMRMLGACYTYGLGVRTDREQGRAWYRKAAEAGDTVAQQELQAAGAR